MRDDLVRSLRFARTFVGDGVVPERCPFHRMHNADSAVCRECRHSQSCRWICDLDENVSFAERTTHELTAALGYAVEYGVTVALQHGHYWNSCPCECCTWIRDCQRLLGESGETGDDVDPHLTSQARGERNTVDGSGDG